ncbi:hypothetical protein ACIO6T_37890 [Streptomyces sp. NPDC087532]|uniref:hypothetical protein n=1 Tax=Streptomyces sp. NPDC087532 TaxID=3365795 RepID=UPI0038134F19
MLTNPRTRCPECGSANCQPLLSAPRQVTLTGLVVDDPVIDGIVTAFRLVLGPSTADRKREPEISLRCHSTRAGFDRGLLTRNQPLHVTGTFAPYPHELLVDSIATSPKPPHAYQAETIETTGPFVIVHGRATSQTGHAYVHHTVLAPSGVLLATATSALLPAVLELLTPPGPGH